MDVDGILQAASMMLGPERAAASAVAVASGQQQKMSGEAPRKDISTGNAPALPATAHDQPGSVAAVPSASEPARKRRKLVEIRPREDHNAGDKTRKASSGGAAPKAAAATASVNTDKELLSAAALYAKIRQPLLSQNGFDPLQPSALV